MWRITMTSTYRSLEAVSPVRMPWLTMLPRIRSCQPQRCQTASMLPHSHPPDPRPSQNHVKVMTCKAGATLLSVKPWRKENPALTCGMGVFSLDIRFTQGSPNENSAVFSLFVTDCLRYARLMWDAGLAAAAPASGESSTPMPPREAPPGEIGASAAAGDRDHMDEPRGGCC